jgi:hypothetical protein
MADEIKSVADLVTIPKPGPQAHVRWLWRGHANAEWDLRPGVYREDRFPAKDENQRLLLERHLAQDFRVEAAGLLESSKEDADVYFLQQHYGIPTRLLDWSQSALAALFFAVVHHNDKDGALFVMDGYQLAATQKVDHALYQGVVTSRHPLFCTAVDRIFKWRDDRKFPEFIMAVRADQADTRMARQRSTFTFHVPGHEVLTLKENASLRQFKIPAARKIPILGELSALGTDDFSIYNDLESLARRLKRAHGIS